MAYYGMDSLFFRRVDLEDAEGAKHAAANKLITRALREVFGHGILQFRAHLMLRVIAGNQQRRSAHDA